jgi:hypothetical protein
MTSVRIAAVAVIAVFAFSESSTGAILEFHSEHCVVIQLKPPPPLHSRTIRTRWEIKLRALVFCLFVRLPSKLILKHSHIVA